MLDLDKVKNFSADKRRSRFYCLLYSHLLLLITLTAIRGVFYFIFNEDTLSFQETLISFLYGLIFDFRAVLIILIPTSIIALIPITLISSNLFSKTVIVLQAVSVFLYLLFAAFDFAHFDLTKLRVGDNFREVLSQSNITSDYLWQNYPILLITSVSLIMTILLTILLELIKRRHLYKGQYGLVFFPYRFERLAWVILLILLVYFQAAKVPVMNKDLLKSDKEFLNQLGMNPMNNLIEQVLD